jgi:hypothetical protein
LPQGERLGKLGCNPSLLFLHFQIGAKFSAWYNKVTATVPVPVKAPIPIECTIVLGNYVIELREIVSYE